MTPNKRMIRSYRFWLGLAVGWALIAAICLVELWPKWPASRQQWALLVVVGPPLYVFFEWLGEKMTEPTKQGEQDQSAVSMKRIAVLLLRFIVFLVVVWGAVAIGSSLLSR